MAKTPAALLFRRRLPASLSQISGLETAPKDPISSHIPTSGPAVIRDGIMLAMMNRECEDTITNPGRTFGFPLPKGIRS